MGNRHHWLRGVRLITQRAFEAVWLATISAIIVVILAGPVFGEGSGGELSADTTTRSTDPVLISLAVSAGTLSPQFSDTHLDYTVSDVPYGTRVLTITALPEPGATATYWHYPDGSIAELVDEDAMSDGLQVSLDVGEKIVEVSVTKGSRYRDYRLEITRLRPTVSIRPINDAPVYEGATIKFEIRRFAAAADPLAVRVLIEEVETEVGAGHANVLADEIDGSSSLYYIEGGEATTTVTVETSGDSVWEGHSKVRMGVVSNDLYTIDTSASTAAIVVQDDEFPESTGVLTVSPNPVGEGSGKTTATVTVTTAGDKKPHGEAPVAVKTSDGAALAGSDYTGVDASVKFTEADFSSVMVGENTRYRASKNVAVIIWQDTDDETDETFSISASTVMGSPVSIGEDYSMVSVTITDDDEPLEPAPTLTSLAVDTGTLTPAFSPETLSYTVPDVGYEKNGLTIITGVESGTTVTFLDSSNNAIEDLDDMTSGHQVYIGIGVTVVKIRVAKGDASREYSLSITRAKPTVSVRAPTNDPATEGEKIEFEVSRSVAAGDALAVKFVLDEIGVSAGVDPGDILIDYQEEAIHSVTIAANETSATVEMATSSDSVWENHSRIQMEIAVDDSYIIHGTEGSATVLVRDDEFVASVAELSVAPNPVGEGAGKTVATVTLTTDGDRKPHGWVTIPVTTSEGTATAGSDFTALGTSITFAESDFSGVEVDGNARFRASKSVDVGILQDSLSEEDETFTVAVGTPSDAQVTLDADSKSTSVTITDDELPAFTALSVSHGTLTPAFSSTLLSYTVPDIEYETHLLTIYVTPESGAEVSFLDSSDNHYDDLDDMAKGHQVYLSIGSTIIRMRVEEDGALQDYTLVLTRAKPTVSIRAVTTGHAVEGDTLRFEVSRSSAAGDVLEMRVGMDEVDLIEGEGHGDILPDAAEGTSPLRTIEAGESSLVFSVDTVADDVWEKHSSVEMAIKSESWYDIDSGQGTATVAVRDDDFPDSLAVLTVSPNPVREGVGKTMATVTLTTSEDMMPHSRVSVPISTSDGTAKAGEDYTAVDSSLALDEGDFSEVEEDGNIFYRASKSVEIEILDDNVDEDDESFNVALGTPTVSAVGVDPEAGSVSVTINDQNSRPVVSVSTTPDPPEVSGRGAITLDGTSTDSDNDTLTYAWTTDPANFGTFDNPAVEDTTWTAPAPLTVEQTVTLTLTIADDGTPRGVTAAAVAVIVWANQPPTVEVTNEDGIVKGGETVMLGAMVSDPESGELGYEWSGGGSFEDESVKDARWTVPAATDVEQAFTLTLTARDELGLTGTDSVELIVPASNRDPAFPESEGEERNVDEGAAAGVNVGDPVTATDADSDPLTYTLQGEDAASFDIDGTGQITVAAGTTLDYEVKDIYAVEVSVSDGRDEGGDIDHAIDASLAVKISIGDVEEHGEVSFSSDELRVGEEVQVSVRDPDDYEPSNPTGSVDYTDVVSWLWERSDNADGPWAQISESTTATYVPTVEDEGKYLRVTAGYTDRRGPGKSAGGVSGRVGTGIKKDNPLLVMVSPSMAIINSCAAITLDAITSYAGGDVLSYSWSAHPNVGHFDEEDMGSTTWSAPDPGQSSITVVLTLTVTDEGEESATDTVVVTVRGKVAETGVGN